MDRNINLSPWEEVSIITNFEHHTIIEKASIIIINTNDDYFYVHDDIEKIRDVSLMPPYIKEDWINYNKKDLDMITLNFHIKEYEDKLRKSIDNNPVKSDKEKELEETIQVLKSLRRELIIKGII